MLEVKRMINFYIIYRRFIHSLLLFMYEIKLNFVIFGCWIGDEIFDFA